MNCQSFIYSFYTVKKLDCILINRNLYFKKVYSLNFVIKLFKFEKKMNMKKLID